LAAHDKPCKQASPDFNHRISAYTSIDLSGGFPRQSSLLTAFRELQSLQQKSPVLDDITVTQAFSHLKMAKRLVVRLGQTSLL
jgi:hypothetical protein